MYEFFFAPNYWYNNDRNYIDAVAVKFTKLKFSSYFFIFKAMTDSFGFQSLVLPSFMRCWTPFPFSSARRQCFTPSQRSFFFFFFFRFLNYSYDSLLSVILDVVKLFSLWNNYYKGLEEINELKTVIFLQKWLVN